MCSSAPVHTQKHLHTVGWLVQTECENQIVGVRKLRKEQQKFLLRWQRHLSTFNLLPLFPFKVFNDKVSSFPIYVVFQNLNVQSWVNILYWIPYCRDSFCLDMMDEFWTLTKNATKNTVMSEQSRKLLIIFYAAYLK